MHTLDHLHKGIPLIEKKIGYEFKEKALLELAFVHRSFANENREYTLGHNERLEFLGDSILGLVVSDFLYTHLPEATEGKLSYLRSRLVEAPTCALYLNELDLAHFLIMGKGEAMNVGKGRETILADLFEALMGAIYLDGGLEVAREFFFRSFEKNVQNILVEPHRNWKAELQDYCQKKYQRTPIYFLEKEEGPDHLKTFFSVVKIDEKELGQGTGTSKKESEQKAAMKAIKELGL